MSFTQEGQVPLAPLYTVVMTANGHSRLEGLAGRWRWVSGHCSTSGYILAGLSLLHISMSQFYSHNPSAVCKPFSLTNRGKAQHVLEKKETPCFPVEGRWCLNLGKRAMLPHSQAEFPMATDSRKAGNQFNSWHQNAFPYVKLSETHKRHWE